MDTHKASARRAIGERHRAIPLRGEVWERLRHVSTATLATQLLRRGFRNCVLTGLVPLRPDLRMVGYAFTLRYVPAREDVAVRVEIDNATNIQRLAVEAIGRDEILVIDARGDIRAGSLGNILGTRLQRRGAAGIVTDGAVRDTPSFRELELPVYAAGSHASLASVIHYPADMNVPIGCGGVLIMPGDVLVGDAEAVVAIPRAITEEVAFDAFEQEQLEEFILAKIRDGAAIGGVYPPDEQTREEYRAARPRP